MDPLRAVLVYRACLAAVWSDRAMTPAERERLSGLVESLGADEPQREALRRETLREVKPELVLADLARLDAPSRRAAFEECLSVLAGDRVLSRPDLRFLGRLRRACGVGLFEFEGRLLRLWWHEGVAVFRWKTLGVVLGVGCLACYLALRPPKGPPVERPSGRAVRLAADTAASDAALPREDAEAVYQQVKDSVAYVEILVGGDPKWDASGAVIGDDDAGGVYILTNKHVVWPDKRSGPKLSYRVRFPAGAPQEARLDYYSRRSDLALLYIPRPAGAVPMPLRLVPRARLRVGEPVFVVGNPLGLKYTLTAGIVSALRDEELQTDATADHGSSGGPVLDATGGLIGVLTEGDDKKNLEFALYADEVMGMLRERAGGLAARGGR